MAILALTVSSCQKGDTGPAGSAGTNGTNGTNGVANITSAIYPVTPGSWSNPSTDVYTVSYTNSAISDANHDGIEVFISTNGSIWFGLPSTNLISSGDNVEFNYSNGQIEFLYIFTSAPTSTLDFKVVVIPPAIMKQHPNTNWSDYNNVIKYCNQ